MKAPQTPSGMEMMFSKVLGSRDEHKRPYVKGSETFSDPITVSADASELTEIRERLEAT